MPRAGGNKPGRERCDRPTRGDGPPLVAVPTSDQPLVLIHANRMFCQTLLGRLSRVPNRGVPGGLCPPGRRPLWRAKHKRAGWASLASPSGDALWVGWDPAARRTADNLVRTPTILGREGKAAGVERSVTVV
jgi:hypothetical protein